MAVHPYLNFGTNAREAFTRYQDIFGGDLTILTMADMPAGDGDAPPDMSPDLVMHAALVLDGALLMASDTGAADFAPMHGIYVNWTTPDTGEAERVFAALADGGEIEMPMETTFWAPRFGVCRDRFGTPWMIAAEAVTDADA